jgi:hypothetical protein
MRGWDGNFPNRNSIIPLLSPPLLGTEGDIDFPLRFARGPGEAETDNL